MISLPRNGNGSGTPTLALSERERLGRLYRPHRAEQETTLRWDREDPTVHVWSADPVTWRKMERLGIAPSRESHSSGRLTGRWYRIPLARFRWGLKRPGVRRPGLRPPSRRVAVQTTVVDASSDTLGAPPARFPVPARRRLRDATLTSSDGRGGQGEAE